MNYINSSFLLLCTLLYFSCTSSEKSKDNTTEYTTSQAEQPIATLPLDVGTVHVKLTITDTSSQDNQISAEVDEVLGYGASTPVLNKGRELTINVARVELDSTLNVGDSFTAILSPQPPKMGDNNSQTRIWQLIKTTTPK